MTNENQLKKQWYLLTLTVLSGAFVATLPISCMPALFKEISDDLGLSLVQIGTVWGAASLAGIFVSILAGILSDKFGVKIILILSCILTGITGSMRGFTHSFFALSFTVFLNGIVRLIVPINLTKSIGIWFKGKYLGTAMGISAVGMGLGLMLGPMISSSVLSPLLGGWRNVMHFYGIISILVGILWMLFKKESPRDKTVGAGSERLPIRQIFSNLMRNRDLWFLGITLMFRVGCIMGMTGYLPLYLRDQGWAPANADGTLAAFYAGSTLCVVPLASLSDRLGSRKIILYPAIIITIICFSILPLVKGTSIWILMIATGIFMDGFMSICVTLALEIKGIGPALSGTALGLIFTIGQLGSVFSPPIGNSFARFNPGFPLLFWTLLSVISLFTLFPIKEMGWKGKKASS
jgi:nitrate/nitrite transporter NarK